MITRPDGTESVEEVDEPTELIERSVQFMNTGVCDPESPSGLLISITNGEQAMATE